MKNPAFLLIVLITSVMGLSLLSCGGSAGNEDESGPAPSVTARMGDAEFTVSDLNVVPREATSWTPGNKDFIVTVLVTNTGMASGTYTAVLQVDGTKATQKNLSLEPGTAGTVELTVTQSKPGTHGVALSPFTIGSPKKTPHKALVGDEVTISARVTNGSASPWQDIVVLTLDGDELESRELYLDGGSAETVSFEGIEMESGTYTIEADRLSTEFKINTRGNTLSWILGGFYAVAFILSAGLSVGQRRRGV